MVGDIINKANGSKIYNPDDLEKACNIGNSETVDKAGASSVIVYIIFDINFLLNS